MQDNRILQIVEEAFLNVKFSARFEQFCKVGCSTIESLNMFRAYVGNDLISNARSLLEKEHDAEDRMDIVKDGGIRNEHGNKVDGGEME